MSAASDKFLNALLKWAPGAPLAALCWAVACAAFEAISMVSLPPMLLLVSGVWVCALHMQLNTTREPVEKSSVNHGLLAYTLLLAGIGIIIWLGCCHAGKVLLEFYSFPAVLFGISRFCKGRLLRPLGILMESLALGMACAVPAFYLAFSYFPLHLVLNAPVWYLGLLFFLAAWERQKIRSGGKCQLAPMICAGMMLVSSLYCSQTHAPFDRAFFTALSMGSAMLLIAPLLSKRLSTAEALVLNWLAVILPAILGMGLYAPECW